MRSHHTPTLLPYAQYSIILYNSHTNIQTITQHYYQDHIFLCLMGAFEHPEPQNASKHDRDTQKYAGFTDSDLCPTLNITHND